MDNIHPQSIVEFDPNIQRVLDYLQHKFPGYPFLKSTDTLFVEELQRDFPHLNILEEIKTFRWYFDDDLSRNKKTKTHRATIRRWIARSEDWRR